MTIRLYDHQRNSVEKMERLEREKRVMTDSILLETTLGVLADKAGYGKTRTTIALIERNNMEWKQDESFIVHTRLSAGNHFVSSSEVKRYKRYNLTLVVVDKTILHQWVAEFANSTLRVKIIRNKSDLTDLPFREYDVALISSNVYNEVIQEFNGIRHDFSDGIAFKRLVIDDPDVVKIPRMKSVQAGFVWFISSNPSRIESVHRSSKNHFIGEIVKYSKETPFGSYLERLTVKNTNEELSASFRMPEPTMSTYNCYSPLYSVLNGVVTEEVLNMSIDDLVNRIGGIKSSNCVSTVIATKGDSIAHLQQRMSSSNNPDMVAKWTQNVADLRKQVELLTTRTWGGSCSICYEPLKQPVMEQNCCNVFCAGCLLKWLITNRKCPLCRCSINTGELIYHVSNSEPRVLKTKEMVIKEILHMSAPDSKFVLYTEYEETKLGIQNALDESGVSYTEVKGSSSAVANSLAQSKLVFLNPSCNGVGVDFGGISDLIVYHYLPSLDKVVDRMNRLGRTTPLRVHKLFYTGEE
jgi:hypothetical protein